MRIPCLLDISSITRKKNYLSEKMQVQEGSYIDYSVSINSNVEKKLITKYGADIDLISNSVDCDNIIETEPTVTAINSALVRASRSPAGGVVYPLEADKINIGSPGQDTIVQMQDNTILDASRIGNFSLGGTDRRSAVECREKQNVGIHGVKSDGGNGFHYGIRLEDSYNVVIQHCDLYNRDQNSIRLSTRSQKITVRFCEINPGLDTEGNGTRRNQHGIVAGSFSGPGQGPASDRFGIVYSTDQSWYSNKIKNTDGHAMDGHCAGAEICGNWCEKNQRGSKFPHSADLVVHNNRFKGARRANDGPLVLRFYSANDWNVGVGYECDKIFFFENIFEDNNNLDIRFDGIHGDVYFINNTYINNGGRILLATANSNSTDPNSFRGKVHVWGEDESQPRSVGSGVPGGSIVTLSDTRLRNLEKERIIDCINETKNQSWGANVSHPVVDACLRN